MSWRLWRLGLLDRPMWRLRWKMLRAPSKPQELLAALTMFRLDRFRGHPPKDATLNFPGEPRRLHRQIRQAIAFHDAAQAMRDMAGSLRQ